MQTKAPAPAQALAGRSLPALATAYFEAMQLKHLYRQGWLRRGVSPERCESVAEHTLGVALLSLFIADQHFPTLDVGKVVRIALLHDLAEARVGDITPHDGVSVQDKHARERAAARELLGALPSGDAYLALWEEYEAGASPEARLVRQVDRLEMAFQACAYEHQGVGDLTEFYASAERAMEAPELRALLEELRGARP